METHETPQGQAAMQWEAGDVYEIVECPSCDGVLLTKYFWHDHLTAEGVEYEILYPTDRGLPAGLPESIAKAYDAAQRVKNVDANAFGVLLRRVMESVCRDRRAQGRSLAEQLRDLSGRGEIPSQLVAVANGVRHLGNIGAHAGLGELSPVESALLDDLTRAVLEYVYSAPLLARKAEQRLRELRGEIGGTE